MKNILIVSSSYKNFKFTHEPWIRQVLRERSDATYNPVERRLRVADRQTFFVIMSHMDDCNRVRGSQWDSMNIDHDVDPEIKDYLNAIIRLGNKNEN